MIFYCNDTTHKEVEKKVEVDKLKQLKHKKSFRKVKGQFKQEVELKRKKEYRKPTKETTYCFFFNAQEHNVQKSQG